MNNHILELLADEHLRDTPHRLTCKDVEQIASDVHYHHQLIEDHESDMIIKDKYQMTLTPEEREIMVKYHDLVLKIHCES